MFLSRATDAGRELLGRLARTDRFDLALRLTLLDFLLQPMGEPAVRFALLTVAGVGLLSHRMLRSPILWWGATALLVLRVVSDWPLADNHAYLICYWCGAIALALSSRDPDAFLAHNGRWLIGLVFLFATFWKAVLSPDFLSGTAFQVMLILDPRFEDFTRLATGVTPEWIEAQRAILEQHLDGARSAPVLAAAPVPFVAVARIGTIWTVAWEGLVAICFLWPVGRGPSLLRDASLQIFCVTTYAVATVAGFGWLLVAMGVGQCDPGKPWPRAAYLLLFALILFYREVPWLEFAAERWAPS